MRKIEENLLQAYHLVFQEIENENIRIRKQRRALIKETKRLEEQKAVASTQMEKEIGYSTAEKKKNTERLKTIKK